MSQTLEQIALRVAKDMTTTATVLHARDETIIEFAYRLVEALGAQEPVAIIEGYFTPNDYATVVVASTVFNGQKLYAAPQLPQREGWQWVPVEPTEEMLEAARTQAWVDAKQLRPMQPLNATTWDISAINRYKAMLAAAPKPEDTP